VKKDGPKMTQVPSLQRQNKATKNSKVKVWRRHAFFSQVSVRHPKLKLNQHDIHLP